MLFNFSIYCTTFNPIAKTIIPIGIPSKKVQAETETHSLTTEVKSSQCSI